MEKMSFELLSSFLLSQITNLVLFEQEPRLEYIFDQLDEYQIPLEHWQALTIPQAKCLGFRKWDVDSNLMLIPGYLYSFIPAGLALYSISGEETEYLDYTELDSDCRFGCLAYGIHMQEHN